MVSLRSAVAAAVTALAAVGLVQAVPLADKLKSLSPSARDVLKRSTSAPRFVVYFDRWASSFPSASDLQGFNVFALTFLLTSGAVDEALDWQRLPADQRTAHVNEYNNAGISLVVSAFGSANFGSPESPTSSDPVVLANSMAQWVTEYGVNGIDVDYEDSSAFNQGTAESWLIRFTQQLRERLPRESILTHSPVAPWFAPNRWSGGGYLEVHKRVGSLIDWYNVQFYNQGASEYTTCAGLLYTSSSNQPQSALFQIAANGIPLDRLVIGKPATDSDATNGHMDPSTLASCVSQAASRGWDGGVAAWQYPDATSSWIRTVRGNTWRE